MVANHKQSSAARYVSSRQPGAPGLRNIRAAAELAEAIENRDFDSMKVWFARRALPAASRIQGRLRRASRLEAYALERFQSRESDIYIVSFPKSGATLMQMLLYQLTTDGDMDFSHIHTVAPFLDQALMTGEQGFLDSLPGPRVFKTHWYWDLVNKCAGNGKCIYIVRHPGDVVISVYHHQLLALGKPASLVAEHARLEFPPFGKWRDHTVSWWPHRFDPNVLFLRYEDITRDLPLTIKTIAEFCEVPLTTSLEQRVRERCSISFMREYEAKFDPRLATTLVHPPTFVRKGESGGWKAQLNHVVKATLADELRLTSEIIDDDGAFGDFFGVKEVSVWDQAQTVN